LEQGGRRGTFPTTPPEALPASIIDPHFHFHVLQ
jgi:hypothetical protein